MEHGQLTIGESLRDEGTARVLSSEEIWRERVGNIIDTLAAYHQEFTAEDVRRWADVRGVGEPHHENCWGAALITAAKEHIIVPVGYQPAKRPEAHARPIRVWKGA